MQEVEVSMKAILFDLDETIILDDAVGDAAYLAAATLAAEVPQRRTSGEQECQQPPPVREDVCFARVGIDDRRRRCR